MSGKYAKPNRISALRRLAKPAGSLHARPIALLCAVVVLAALVLPQLLHRAPRIVGSNGVAPMQFVATSAGGGRLCQAHEVLVGGAGALRTTIGTFHQPGPALAVEWRRAGRVLDRATLAAGWKEGVVRIPLAAVPRETTGELELCISARGPWRGRLAWGGETAAPGSGVSVDGAAKPGRLSFVSEAPGRPSLLAMFDTAASRFGAGNARWLGAWSWWAIVLLVLGALAAAGAALLHGADESARRVPRAGRLCAVTALLVASAWALLIPPMHVPDEISHVAYVQSVVEDGRLPSGNNQAEPFSAQERNLLHGLGFYSVIGRTSVRPPWTPAQEAGLRAFEQAPASRSVANGSTASTNPPLYYLLEAPVYWAVPSGDLLDKLLPMRLLSGLLGSITVLAIYLFLRELLPRSPWSWTAGALACAFQPLFGFMTAGVNADALLFACAATTFWLLARVLRRGLTLRRTVALGVAVVAGLLTKPLFIGLLPAVAIAMLVAAERGRRGGLPLRTPARWLAAGAGVIAVPLLAYNVIASALWSHPYFGAGTTPTETLATGAGSIRDELSYIWQLWLPRVPGLQEQFPGPLPLREIWLQGFLGRFGWLDYGFSGWVLNIYTWTAVALLIAVVASLVVARAQLRHRWIELAAYAAGVVGIAAVVGSQQYRSTLTPNSPQFIQARYLLPLLALYGGLVAVAVRLAGRRAGPYVGITVVMLAALHGISAMLVTVTRYYT
jgi:4-amino-4-deoxy-L-arabinose transferase-like glycosyltransferase